MINLIRTAERTNDATSINNYIFYRHLFAYNSVPSCYLTGKDVLELGCGTGYGMKVLSERTNTYVAVDKKKPAVEVKASNTYYHQCHLPDLQTIPDESFDTIICFQVIEHIKEDDLLLAAIKRILRPRGVAFITTPNRFATLVRNPFHIREYTPGEFSQKISGHFTQFDVTGVYGNEKVMAYYEANKNAVAKIVSFDRWDLINRMPAWLLRVPYSVMNNINRIMLFLSVPEETNNITDADFFVAPPGNNCLDLYAIIRKN
ncbi:class I SAM-dependent methyltransferase [Chitinophaga oryzae]|uniref:Class I SAM-dependent methyltransferase n=1 Tax=Chitinophaga oryzae TaxID=2725414 RepID=A0AAE7D7E8_9BACT|nr:class I SAM-dependent methyltransferase [Chitinophaga oryzae]QJB32176.1 class I SAM-dependent methyltransferase [Chitinophaga oryzae]QJB38654.1 class I SAM-dependent methyltransferase [Chitinophaga oryzae]